MSRGENVEGGEVLPEVSALIIIFLQGFRSFSVSLQFSTLQDTHSSSDIAMDSSSSDLSLRHQKEYPRQC